MVSKLEGTLQCQAFQPMEGGREYTCFDVRETEIESFYGKRKEINDFCIFNVISFSIKIWTSVVIQLKLEFYLNNQCQF